MVDSPSGRALVEAPRWDLADTEGYGGGNCFSLAPWMFSGYVGIYRRKKYVGGRPRGPRDRGRALQGVPSYLVGPSELHRCTPSSYIYLRTPKTSREPPKHNFHRRNLLYPRDPILEPSPTLRRRGNQPRRASTSSPSLSDEV